MSERPRLLVLGAGRHQLELIRRAEARGIAVVVSDYLTDSPGKAIASFVADDGDAIDVDRNIAIAEEFAVDGVVTVGTDQAIPAVAGVADRLGLPCHVNPVGARRATDKAAMKRAFAEHDVPTARAWILEHSSMVDEEIRANVPVVVKPTDSQGQRATVVVHDPRALEAAVDDAVAQSRSGRAAVEVFVQGPEVTATAWVVGTLAVILIGIMRPLLWISRVLTRWLTRGKRHVLSRGELKAVIEGLRALKKRCLVELYSDSSYVLQGLQKWVAGWKRNGWMRKEGSKKKPVKNVELWQELDQLVASHEVTFHHVRGHSGHPENERCDQMAVEASQNV